MIDGAGHAPRETFDLRIDSISSGGDGVGRHNGLVVFVPRTAPRDLVRVRALQRDRLMRGKVIEVLEPSPARAEPRCDHYTVDRCGGCQIQHLRYEEQLHAKSGIIRDALARIGKLEIEAPEVEPSPRPWRYRRKLTLAMRWRDGRWVAGLHRYDAPDEVFELRDCPITGDEVMAAWELVRSRQELLPHARELRAAVRLLPNGFAFTVEGARVWKASEQFFTAIPSLVELWWHPQDRARRLLHSRSTTAQAGASFTQVNPGIAKALRDWVVSRAMAAEPTTAIDAYAGTGDIAVALAEQGVRVTAIERDREAARVSETRLPVDARVIAASVESALPAALPADVVVLNPPRAGLHHTVARHLSDAGSRASPRAAPRTVIYVSCNPATLARDIRRLDAYRVESVRAFDMFPQTAHVETVCALVSAA